MARVDIARQWLDANDPKRPAAQFAHLHKKRRRIAAQSALPAIHYHPLDEAAHDAVRKAERAAPNYAAFPVADFVLGKVGFDGDECVFVPFAIEFRPAVTQFGMVSMTAARAMCLRVHGQPEDEAHVARHKCGNGHKSCVNPKHLCWGTTAQNANDRYLHTARPTTYPDAVWTHFDAIIADPRLPNVMAVDYGIPTSVIEQLQRTKECPPRPALPKKRKA
jgi:hypothetical protein